MGCLHYTANIPKIRLRVGEGRSHPERESPSPTPRCSYFRKRQDCLKIQDFLKIQERRQLGVFCSLNPFFGGFRGGSSSMMHPPPGALPTRSCGFFCQATSTGGGAHHLTLLGRAVPPILLLLEGKGKGSHAYDSMAIRRLRPFSHARIPALRGFSVLRGFLCSGRAI